MCVYFGCCYGWVNNESENTRVWFDDVKVTQMQALVTQATDYGVWGDVLREQKAKLDTTYLYKYAYQGNFAERDKETGWNHFELREYDPVIGRWTAMDPNMQYYSPYLSMGNNPVSRTDPDGGLDEYNMINGEKIWVSNKGGSDVEYINYYENVDSGFGNGTFTSVYTGTSAQGLTNAGTQLLGGVPLVWSYEGIVIDYVRTTYTSNSTVGEFTTSSGGVEGYYLEPAWDESLGTTAGSDRAVEPGTYYLTRHISTKYTAEKHAYRLLSPHGRVTILQHTGNGPEDTTGCLLPGTSTSTDYVSGSTGKREELYNLIQGNNFGAKIIIRNTNQGTPRNGY